MLNIIQLNLYVSKSGQYKCYDSGMKTLIDTLKLLESKINDRSNPFDTITVIVPSSKTTKWIKAYYLKNNSSILMNVSFITLNEYLINNTNKEYVFASNTDIKLFIIKYLLERNTIEDNKIKDICNKYLSDNKIYPIKVYDLACSLADLYIQYDEDNLLNDLIKDEGFYKSIYDSIYKYKVIRYTHILNNHPNIKVDSNTYLFGFSNISKIEKELIDRLEFDDKNIFNLDIDDINNKSIESLISAPSKIREVECVHSIICNLIKDNKDISLSDFTILAPNINDYRSTIKSVFKQDNIEFPNISYSMMYKDDSDNDLYKGLQLLFDIYNLGYFTRSDYLAILNNKIIKQSRNVVDDDIDSIKKMLLNTSTFRNKSDNSYDDWNFLRSRLISSKIMLKNDTKAYLSFNEKDYASYSSIDLDDNKVVKIISLIDDIKEFINIKKKNEISYGYIKYVLSKFFSFKDDDIETNKEFIKLLAYIDNFYLLNIPLNINTFNILIYTLLDIAKSNKFKSSEMFTRGVTCLDLDTKTIIYSKYLFILGIDSNVLPVTINKSELDIRDDNNILKKEKNINNTFILQVNNAEKVYISYINQDLKTDEEYYPSPTIKIIDKDIETKIIKVSLDETRNYKDLYTRRELKNKEYYQNLFNAEDNENE